MASNFGIRNEVKDVTQDILLFDISYSTPTLGKDYRIIGAVLPLTKALIAVCLCAGLLGAGAIGLVAQTQNQTIQCN